MQVRALGWAVVLVLTLEATAASAQQAVGVSVDPSVTYQTILGWGKTTPWQPVDPMLRDQCIDRAVNDLGINRLRFEGLCGNGTHRRSWEWLNDNDDPFTIDWLGFNTAGLDERVISWLVPWKKAVEARGEKFDLYVSPSFFRRGSSGDVPSWLLNNPDEYAEWALALLIRLRDVHGITPDYYCICNEAGNDNAFSPRVVGTMIKALMPRLRQAGFATTVQFPESINVGTAMRYISALRDDPEVWRWIGLIAYHWYGTKPEQLPELRDFAWGRGLPTAQTEFMHLTIDHLYNDLVLGGTSYWEIYGLATPDFKAALSHISSTTFRGGDWYWRFRQVSRYVRPGAVRIGCRSTEPGLRCLAFAHQGRTTVVLINTTPPHTAREVTIAGLAPGIYGVSQCVNRHPYEELGVGEAGPDGRLTVTVVANSVLTVYPRSRVNAPPVVTEWRSQPDFVELPALNVRLLCSATDPEKDDLSCSWRIVGRPDGAAVELHDAGERVAAVSGITRPGDYLFEVSVSDGNSVVTRRILMKAFAGNQAPVPMDVHNRIPVWVTVRDGGTLLRAGAWDVEDDPVTYRWSVASAPPGAAPVLEKPGEQACQVTGLTVPGDYVFRLAVSDPTHTVTVDHTVPVYP